MRLIAALMLAFTLAAGNTVVAEEELVTLPLPKVFDLSEHPNLERDWGDAIRAAWAGDCGPVLERANLIPSKYRFDGIPEGVRINRIPYLSLQMLDRGICTDTDPERVTRYLHDLAERPFSREILTDLGWRYWHGYGVSQDRERARRLFDEGILGAFFVYNDPEWGRVSYALRYPLPNYARRAADHISARLETPEGRVAFALDIAVGNPAVLPEGHYPVAYTFIADRILDRENTPEASYHLGRLIVEGVLSAERAYPWEFPLKDAANCLHRPAIDLLLTAYRSAEDHPSAAWNALTFLYYLEALGEPISDDIAYFEALSSDTDPRSAHRHLVDSLAAGEYCRFGQ